jgi:hypothetical protein
MANVLIYSFEQGYRLVNGFDLNRMIEALNTAFSQTASTGTIGQPNGIAALDGAGKIPLSEMPALGANPSASAGLSAVNGAATTYMRSDAAPAISQAIAPTWTARHIFSQDIQVGGGITSYLNVATVGSGVPVEFAQVNSATTLNANQSSATLYAVPAGGGGMYRAIAYAVVVTPDGASSTLPSVGIGWTDSDTSVGLLATNVTTTNTANAAGAFGQGVQVFNAKAGTNITWQTSSYASGTAGAMKYAVHIRLEYLG